MIRVGDLAGQNFRASAFLVTELVDVARIYDFSEVSVPVHGFAVNPVKISIAGLIEIELSRENMVLHACDGLIVTLIIHVIDLLFKLEFPS